MEVEEGTLKHAQSNFTQLPAYGPPRLCGRLLEKAGIGGNSTAHNIEASTIRSAGSQPIADLLIEAGDGLQHHSATANE
jgi:hypothetical protein